MARSKRGQEGFGDLDLAPIMNMVVILIPLLLLSIVFLEIGVINITAPKLAMGPPSDKPPEDDKPALNLTVAVSAKGFQLAATGAVLPEMAGCPVPGPTICLEKQDVDPPAKFANARRQMAGGDMKAGEMELEAGIAAYNWRELYNQLSSIKSRYQDETIVNISADPDIPYAAIVRVMDTARFKLDKDSFGNASEFWAARNKPGTGDSQYEELFPDPILSLAQ